MAHNKPKFSEGDLVIMANPRSTENDDVHFMEIGQVEEVIVTDKVYPAGNGPLTRQEKHFRFIDYRIHWYMLGNIRTTESERVLWSSKDRAARVARHLMRMTE